MHQQYFVRLTKDTLVFSAAHFITYQGNVCEPLHGHNYRVEVRAGGPLDENSYVVDFIALRDEALAVVRWLDHRMLLPTRHRLIRVQVQGNEVEVRFEKRRWVFPRTDCRLLPVPNTTAEMLAQWIGVQLCHRLHQRCGWVPQWIQVEVDECYGQCGVWRSDCVQELLRPGETPAATTPGIQEEKTRNLED